MKAIFCKSISRQQVPKTELVQNFEQPNFGGLRCLICIVQHAGHRYYYSTSLADKCLDFKKATQYQKNQFLVEKLILAHLIFFLKNLK
jgi:hypothetical protein